MSVIDLEPLSFPEQDNIRVRVDYYDEEEEAKLLEYPSADRIALIAGHEIDVPASEFLTYYLFRRKRPGMPGWRNYAELSRKISLSLSHLSGSVAFDGSSIHVPIEVGYPDVHVVECVGEAIGLSVINQIHDMTEADWSVIPRSRGGLAGPTLDFRIASDEQHLIEVETKGSFARSSTQKTSSISNHKASIQAKKAHHLGKSLPGFDTATIRYGTISVLGGPAQCVNCWLLDPPSDEAQMNPARRRVLNRVAFLRDWITAISPRSNLAIALASRLAALEAVSNIEELDGVPLLGVDGERVVDVSAFTPEVGETPKLLPNKSRIDSDGVVGIVIQGWRNSLFFLGAREEIFEEAIAQEFQVITSYKAASGFRRRNVNCRFTRRQFDQMRLPREVRSAAAVSGNYVTLSVAGRMQYANTGSVFGILDVSEML